MKLSNNVVIQSREFIQGVAPVEKRAPSESHWSMSHGDEITEKTFHLDDGGEF